MGIRFFGMSHAKQILQRSFFAPTMATNVPKGHCAVYIGGGQKKRFTGSIILFAEEEFGFNHPMGGLTIPCSEDAFINLTCELSSS
ncbi:hypothetical protein GIB67_007567 [Kingdonia uniflora]|uniref:Uncharacterized protein n=1 Tax=Kingdonia uniflora TaxID=39325 RepID=A0A7J7LN73_9MAGN|nr:hypothetical protein GIB67_007567 [Kingdonia uniflora]